MTKKWTRQTKAEERSSRASTRRESMWTSSASRSRTSCSSYMDDGLERGQRRGRLPTHWRQVFYGHAPALRRPSGGGTAADRLLLQDDHRRVPRNPPSGLGRPARRARRLQGAARQGRNAGDVDDERPRTTSAGASRASRSRISSTRFPTAGAENRFGAVLICEKEGFDELLQAEGVPDRYDLALMSTKGISARAARSLARSLGVPVLHAARLRQERVRHGRTASRSPPISGSA